ncbi:LOW QUALITY PROTEIN: hypothetical protein HID58_045901 [Brassica napus]|uniref:peptidylprolyl isomerase n=1 Tax=Brassica napus TaxID=3708 RepID=A0ABQ8AVV1_BRANA|nr:LOW QUALITY PROTEIN: hypothetical protein HID58_045901 [Brassica napus]
MLKGLRVFNQACDQHGSYIVEKLVDIYEGVDSCGTGRDFGVRIRLVRLARGTYGNFVVYKAPRVTQAVIMTRDDLFWGLVNKLRPFLHIYLFVPAMCFGFKESSGCAPNTLQFNTPTYEIHHFWMRSKHFTIQKPPWSWSFRASLSHVFTRERDGAAGNGAEKQIIRPGTGPKRAPDQTVTVQCTGFGKGGDLSQQFWSTKDAGQKPFSFIVGKGVVIKDVIGMQIGEVARLRHIGAALARCGQIREYIAELKGVSLVRNNKPAKEFFTWTKY